MKKVMQLCCSSGRSTKGKIKGQRYTRNLKRDKDGAVIKDHWDLKGKVS
jgi:hypothetical protein